MSRRAFRAVFAVSSVITLGAAAACGSSKDESKPQAAEGEIVLAPGVTVLDETRAVDVTVLEGKLVFPKATHPEMASKKAGDVLVGDAGDPAKNPWGFLRKVVSVAEEGDQIVVTTEQATLEDVVQEGELAGTLTVPSILPTDPAAHTKTLAPKGSGDPISLLDFSGKTLFSNTGSVEVNAGKTLGYEASVVLSKGTLDFTPTWDVGAKIKPGLSLKGLIKEAHVVATGTLDATAEFDASFKLIGDATGDDVAALIAKKVFKSASTTLADHEIKLPSLKLGFIKVPAHASFKATLKCDLNWSGETRVVVGGKASATVKAGARYDGDKITPEFGFSRSFERIGPEWTIQNDVGLRCAVVPEFRLSLWDVAAGSVVAEAYAGLEAKATCNASTLTGDVSGGAWAGASAKAHAKLDVFGLYEWEKECTLFDVRTPKASFSGSIPLGKGSTCTEVPATPDAPEITEPAPACFGGKDVPGGDAGPGPGVDAGPAGDAGDDAGEAGVKCDHDVCSIGGPLTTGCTKDDQAGKCIESICKNDEYCCEHTWSASCVQHVIDGDFDCAPRACSGS